MANMLKSFATLFAVILCFAFTAIAQETTGDIEGTVKDPNGAVVPGAVVTVKSVGSSTGARPDSTAGFTRNITASNNGFYRMQQIPPGFYSVSVAPVAGFGEATVKNVEVVLGRSTLTDITLAVSGSTNVVDVVADGGVAIDPTSNKVQSNITAQAIDLLPKGTNFTSLLQTTPAVRNEPLSGGFQIDGASGSENTFIIDGQEVSNFRTGVLNINNNIPFQIVQEIQVKSGGFEAEFGGATGGVINATTKSGGNDWHGEIGTSFFVDKFQSAPRPFFRQVIIGEQTPPNPVLPALRTTEEIQPPKDRGTSHFPFATLSGPIIKDRLWFFGAYAPQFINTDRTVQYQTADPRTRTTVATETYNQRIKREYAYGRLDLQLFKNLRMTGSYLWNPVDQRGVLDASTNFSATVPSLQFPDGTTRRGAEYLNPQGGRQSSNNTNGSVIWTPTSRLVVTARGGYSFLNEKIGNYGLPATAGLLRAVVQDRGTPVPPGFGGFGAAGFGQNFPGFQPTVYDATIRRTFDADASYLVDGLAGRHQFKGGFQFNGISNQVDSTLVDTVVFRFGNNIRQCSGIATLAVSPTAIGCGFLQRFAVFGAAGSDNKALYIQDSWQPISRLTLNLGVRIEKEDSPSFAPGLPGITFGWGDKIAPRLGFAFDLFGDGKNKIFGSYGKFYDRFKYELPRGSFGGNFFRNDYFEIFPGDVRADFTRQTIIGTNPDPIGGNCPLPSSTGLSICQRDFRIPSNTDLGLEFGAIDPDIQAFQQTEWTFGFERDLGKGYFFSSRYTHKQVDRAVEDIGFLTSGGGEAYVIGNPGFGLSAQISEENGFVPLKAVRDYDAVEARVQKRFASTAYIDASYTWSRLYGNYAGLASSDEAGRTSPNVNRNFDLPFIGFSALGEPDDGRLPTDRPHSFKFAGAYTYDWSGSNATEVSGFFTAASGTPRTTRFTFDSVTGQVLNGRGDLGRTDFYNQTDMALTHKYRFGRDNRVTLAFDLDIINLFNQDAVIAFDDTISPTNISFGEDDLNLTEDLNEAIRIFQTERTNDRILPFLTSGTNPNLTYQFPQTYQAPRTVRFGFRVLF